MKFKKGDIVKILEPSTKVLHKYRNRIGFSSDMYNYIGKVCTIHHISISGNISLKEFGYGWLADSFKLINHQERLNRKYGYEI